MRLLEALGLKVRIADAAAARPRASALAAGKPGTSATEPDEDDRPVDLDVRLLGDAPWPEELAGAPERLCYTDADTDERGTPFVRVWERGDRFYRLAYSDAIEFLIARDGTRVFAHWPSSLPRSEIVMCVLGPIIGFVLHLRGTPCLHASSVAIDGRAVAFLGHSGAGKSTTAAAFVRRGYRALTDDVLALDERREPGDGRRDDERERREAEGGRRGSGDQPAPLVPSPQPPAPEFYVRPGHNLVRLWPDAVRALFGSEEALPQTTETIDKRHLDLTGDADAFQAEPLPLAAIYVLADRVPGLDAPASILELTGHQALMALVARTYMNYVLDVNLRVRALTVFARLAARVPIRQLTVRHDADRLGDLTDAILADLASLGKKA